MLELSLEGAAARVRSRELSPVELTEASLARIGETRDLGTFIAVTADTARAAAREAERAIRERRYRGPLHGIPVSLKDLFDVAGVPTTGGGSFAVEPAREDSSVTRQLVEAGAILLGKTNLHEFAFGVTSDNPHFGPVRNPWDRERIPGGSSGGSAVAVATGAGYASIGSDTGGSIRIPASLSGVVGLKPTRGRVSLRGAMPLSWTLDHAGPLARSVRDAALVYAAITGEDPLDPSWRGAPGGDPLGEIDAGVDGLRIGVWREAVAEADPPVRALVEAAIARLAAAGADLADLRLPRPDDLRGQQLTIIGTDAYAAHRERFDREAERYGADVRARIARGREWSGADYAAARRARSGLRATFDAALAPYDALALPTTVVSAPLREGQDAVATAQRLTFLTSPFNLTGLPAVSLPCGLADGLPVGLQLAGRRWDEPRLLRVARGYELLRGEFPRPPA